MRWATLLASVAALLSCDTSLVQATWRPPDYVTVDFLSSYNAAPYQAGVPRGLTWFGSHPTPREILAAGMDPRSPSTKEWIARAHYKKLVRMFEQRKAVKEGTMSRSEAAEFYQADINQNEAIEALFDYNWGTLTVAVLYDPATQKHYVSTVPRSDPDHRPVSVVRADSIARQMRSPARNGAPFWYRVVTGGSQSVRPANDMLVLHAEDGACRYYEYTRTLHGLDVGDGHRYYNRGSAIGAWGGDSNYHLEHSALLTHTNSEGYRINLCPDYTIGRGTRGCQIVAYYLKVAYNGDRHGNRSGEFGRPRNLCSRSEVPSRIHSRADACALDDIPWRTQIPAPNRPTSPASGAAAGPSSTGSPKVSKRIHHGDGYNSLTYTPNSLLRRLDLALPVGKLPRRRRSLLPHLARQAKAIAIPNNPWDSRSRIRCLAARWRGLPLLRPAAEPARDRTWPARVESLTQAAVVPKAQTLTKVANLEACNRNAGQIWA